MNACLVLKFASLVYLIRYTRTETFENLHYISSTLIDVYNIYNIYNMLSSV